MLFVMDRLSDFIVSNSKKAAAITCNRSGIRDDKISVIYNGIEFEALQELPKSEDIRSEGKIIGIVARLVPAKDVSTLLRAFARVSSQVRARLIIVGDGPLGPSLKEEAVELGLGDKVFFMGERSDAKEIIKRFDIGVLTSTYEGLSNAIMEYMHAAKPVIATNIAGNPELVVDGVTGYLFEPGNDEQLAIKLLDLLSHPDKCLQMGFRGRDKIVTSFSVEKMVGSWDTVLNTYSS
jgi:glycosyltransferase involved in cell wall biosynthesis